MIQPAGTGAIISADNDGGLALWDTSDGKQLSHVQAAHNAPISAVECFEAQTVSALMLTLLLGTFLVMYV